jgi:hypothetical protein
MLLPICTQHTPILRSEITIVETTQEKSSVEETEKERETQRDREERK